MTVKKLSTIKLEIQLQVADRSGRLCLRHEMLLLCKDQYEFFLSGNENAICHAG